MQLKKFLLLVVFALAISSINCAPLAEADIGAKEHVLQRVRRQIDLNISAEHDDNAETELAIEAIANLWRSPSGKTSIEGAAKVVHHSNAMQSGNTRYSGRLHLHHDYRKR